MRPFRSALSYALAASFAASVSFYAGLGSGVVAQGCENYAQICPSPNQPVAGNPTFGSGGCAAGYWFINTADCSAFLTSPATAGSCLKVWFSQEVYVANASTGQAFGDTGEIKDHFSCGYNVCGVGTDYPISAGTSTSNCVCPDMEFYQTVYIIGYAEGTGDCGNMHLLHATTKSGDVWLP
jgi:hypothetical protein